MIDQRTFLAIAVIALGSACATAEEKVIFESEGSKAILTSCVEKAPGLPGDFYSMGIGERMIAIPVGMKPLGISYLSDYGISVPFSDGDERAFVISILRYDHKKISDLQSEIYRLNGDQIERLQEASLLRMYSGIGSTIFYKSDGGDLMIFRSRRSDHSEMLQVIPDVDNEALVEVSYQPSVSCTVLERIGSRSEDASSPFWVAALGNVFNEYLKTKKVSEASIEQARIPIL